MSIRWCVGLSVCLSVLTVICTICLENFPIYIYCTHMYDVHTYVYFFNSNLFIYRFVYYNCFFDISFGVLVIDAFVVGVLTVA